MRARDLQWARILPTPVHGHTFSLRSSDVAEQCHVIVGDKRRDMRRGDDRYAPSLTNVRVRADARDEARALLACDPVADPACGRRRRWFGVNTSGDCRRRGGSVRLVSVCGA